MNEDNARSVETDFEIAVAQQYARAVRRGYQDERYRQMIQDRGASQAARDLVADQAIKGMFARMAGDGAFDLTIEWLVIQPRFGNLFGPAVVAEAMTRLTRAGYTELPPPATDM